LEETGRNKYFYFFYFYFFLILCYSIYRNTSPSVWDGVPPSQTLPLPLRRGVPLLKLFPQISTLAYAFLFLNFSSYTFPSAFFSLNFIRNERNFIVAKEIFASPVLMETFLCVKKSFHTFKRNPFFLPFFM